MHSSYFKRLNLIRLFSCIAVLLYHLKMLKGGYLAVCVFFVLSGYLSCVSAFKREKFELKSYYSSRFKKIYIPLIIVVFATICILSFVLQNTWLNLKVETTSVLLGYNNYWQINANLDYFAMHADSPFIHLWYIAILIQFDLIFPFLFVFLRKIGDKTNKMIPCIITVLLTIFFSIYFYNSSETRNIMLTYYDTFSRIFSLLFGLSLGFIQCYYGAKFSKKTTPLLQNIMFYSNLLILIVMFILIDADSPGFAIAMLLASFIACQLIHYATITPQNDTVFFDKIVKSLSNISYEIYLVQYPIIFIFQKINLNNTLKIIIMVVLIIFISYILEFAIDCSKNRKYKIVRIITLVIISIVTTVGFYQYITSEDYTEEMKKLEKQLEENQNIFQQKQEEYEKQFLENEAKWLALMNELENNEKNLENIVKNLSVVGIGDSIMLGTVDKLYETFPNGYFDAKTSRTAWVANGILTDLKSRNVLGEPIILNLGTNGDCPEHEKVKILESVGERKVFWINTVNDTAVNVNHKLEKLATNYDNLYIIDWYSLSKGHSEYFIADGIHLSEIGKDVYTKMIFDAIYNVYLDEYKAKKQEMINQHELENKNKISFYGNDVLLNIFSDLETDFNDAKFFINNNFTYDTLENELLNNIKNDTLTNKIVFAFDSTLNLTKEEYLSLIKMCQNSEVYILIIDEYNKNLLSSVDNSNVKVINFYNEIITNENYLMVDKVHLTEEGNYALYDMLIALLNNDT